MAESSEYRTRLSAEMQVSFEREPKKEGCRLQHLSTGCAAFFFKTRQEAEMNLRAAMEKISTLEVDREVAETSMANQVSILATDNVPLQLSLAS